MQRLFIAADHAGFALKEELKKFLSHRKTPYEDLTPSFQAGDDYPAAAQAVARKIANAENANAFGALVCGTGHGMEIAANRFRGIRAVVAHDPAEAVLAREHNHANVLAFGGWNTKPTIAKKILAAFLRAKPSRAERHLRRLRQLDA